MNYDKPVSSYTVYPLSDVIGNSMSETFHESYHYHDGAYGRVSNQSCEIEGHTTPGSSGYHISSYPDSAEQCSGSQHSESFGLDHHHLGNDNNGDVQNKRCTIWDCTTCGVGKVTEGEGCSTTGCEGCKRPVKRRNTANKKERRRTQSINNAFTELRDCIPNVPSDTKLSKSPFVRIYRTILILVLITNYSYNKEFSFV
jgi:hypothetical protein